MKKKLERVYSEKYDDLFSKWQKEVEKNENIIRKKQTHVKQRECYEKLFPELRKQREERERQFNKYVFFLLIFNMNKNFLILDRQFGRNISNMNKNEDDFIDVYDQDTIMNEEERKRLHQSAVIPPLCFDDKQRRYKFINNNGYIKDPIALFKSKHNQVFWCEKEREIFLEKLLLYGKNFELIASFLEKKVKFCCFFNL